MEDVKVSRSEVGLLRYLVQLRAQLIAYIIQCIYTHVCSFHATRSTIKLALAILIVWSLVFSTATVKQQPRGTSICAVT